MKRGAAWNRNIKEVSREMHRLHADAGDSPNYAEAERQRRALVTRKMAAQFELSKTTVQRIRAQAPVKLLSLTVG